MTHSHQPPSDRSNLGSMAAAAAAAAAAFWRMSNQQAQSTKRCRCSSCSSGCAAAHLEVDHRSSFGWRVLVVSGKARRRQQQLQLQQQQQPCLLRLLFMCCWIMLCIRISDPSYDSLFVKALLVPPPAPNFYYRWHPRHRNHPVWGVAIRGGGSVGVGDSVEFTGENCSSSNNNNSDGNMNKGQQQQQQSRVVPLDVPRWDDVSTAVQAVRKACAVTVALQPLTGMEAEAAAMEMTKDDASPVTVADLAVQAVVLHHLMNNNMSQQQEQHTNNSSNTNNNNIIIADGFIAEEDSTMLRQSPALCQRVADAAGLTTAQVLQAIDAGQSHRQWNNNNTSSSAAAQSQSKQQQQRPRRVWCLDPIDGTCGFLRGRWSGGQYAVALALLEDGVPVIGVLGCPNLPHVDDTDKGDLAWSDEEIRNEKNTSSSIGCAQRGCLFVGSQGGGCYQLTVPSAPVASADSPDIITMPARRLQVTSTGSIRDGRFCIGVESYSDAQGQTVQMARLLHGPDGVRADNYTIVQARRMDSQAKHGVLARGGAEWYVRLPRPGYVEWIWDHAAGFVVATEAGGTVTDTAGRPLDFSLGAQLSPDVQGVLMSSGGVWHDALVQAYAAVVNNDAASAAANAFAAETATATKLDDDD